MPSAYNKFNQFTLDLINGVHDFDAHTFKFMLTNTAPVATNAVKADLTEIAGGNGYTAGGHTTAITTSTATGTGKATAADVVVTASGAVGPFRYVAIFNDTAATPLKPLIGWWDYGTSISLASAETFTIDADATNGIFTVA